MRPTVVALVRHLWGKVSVKERSSEENIVDMLNVNIMENIVDMLNVNIIDNDVGGEDWGPCFPARPRGCVACVVWRARTYLALMLVE